MEYVPLRRNLEEVKGIGEAERDKIARGHYLKNEAYVGQELRRIGMAWVIIGGNSGRIYQSGQGELVEFRFPQKGHGKDLSCFPSETQRRTLAQGADELLFLFSVGMGLGDEMRPCVVAKMC